MTQVHRYDGLIYEPRAFWDVALVTTTADTQRVFFDTRNAFLNGERYPVEINEISLAPINYLGQTNVPPASGVGAGRFAGQPCFDVSDLTIAVRQRQNYSRFPINLRGYSPSRTQPPSVSHYAEAGHPLSAFASDLFGILHKKFEKSFVLPQFGSAEIQLTCFEGNNPGAGGPPALSPALFSAAWYEAGGLQGSARVVGVQKTLLSSTTPAHSPFGAVIIGTAAAAASGATFLTESPFPPQHLLGTKPFKGESPTAQGAQRFLGLGLQIDQIRYDDAFLAVGGYGVMTPLSLRTGCRIRTTDGGTKADWWRPGAPCALVFTHITPAQVYRLPQPITLEPGDQLEVELTIPAQTTSAQVPETYSIGIAFNGYAAIEG